MTWSLFTSALTYGGLGIVPRPALSTEPAGMFVIIMVSLVDVMVQNPIINPADTQAVVRFLPTYGSMQAGAAAGFTEEGAFGYACLGLLWLTVFGLIGLVAFHRRTRDHAPAVPQQAAVTITTRADGSLVVTSSVGRWCCARSRRSARRRARHHRYRRRQRCRQYRRLGRGGAAVAPGRRAPPREGWASSCWISRSSRPGSKGPVVSGLVVLGPVVLGASRVDHRHPSRGCLNFRCSRNRDGALPGNGRHRLPSYPPGASSDNAFHRRPPPQTPSSSGGKEPPPSVTLCR